ncbi:N-acetylglucosaminyl-diphospho-decaprenol L-rhamnosyltransferase [compost metagenome]
MQGNQMSTQAVSLSQLFTLVVISHNRPAFLRRAVQYYSRFSCSIVVLDSSNEADHTIAARFPNVDYRHLPQFSYAGFQAKLNYGVESVTTPYMAFAADDDFILQGALTEAAAFLESNPDYGMCHGYTMMYLAQANQVNYLRRDKKGIEDHSSDKAEDRVLSYMGHYLPPFYALTRTELFRSWFAAMPESMSFEWLEISHVYYMLACAKARILPIPYAVREVNYFGSEHNTEVIFTLAYTDPKSVAEREAFAEVLASTPTALQERDPARLKQFAIKAFTEMADCLNQRRSLTIERIFDSLWLSPLELPTRQFGPTQYVEMPFYNQAYFDQLTELEFLINAMPAGKLQLERLEAVWLKQHEWMRGYDNDTAATVEHRLQLAMASNPFHTDVVDKLAQCLDEAGQAEQATAYRQWAQRLQDVSAPSTAALFDKTRSGRLLNWLEVRKPKEAQRAEIVQHLARHNGGPRFCILLLDLGGDTEKLQATFDSLLQGYSRAFQIVVFTTGDLPAATTEQNTLHFVKVSADNYVHKLNQIAERSACDWLMLAEAGDEFTAAGLLRASLELLNAPQCRAVCVDEFQRQADGTLADVMRPGFNLDLLLSLPALMARHWLVRRDVLLQAGGYAAAFSQALEFDLLLRLIEQDGMAGFAHLDEPLLISRAPTLEENPDEKQALLRHLANRGYQAQVRSNGPGQYQIDYRHSERPFVSIILHSEDNLAAVQRALVSVLQRTRYQRHEILIADNASQSPELLGWLARLEEKGGRVRILRSERRLSKSALHNAASLEARGEYLVLLGADSEVVNPNWIETLLNQAQRPEVGIVGAKLVDHDGVVTQAGLVLGLDGVVAAAFAGVDKDATGYLQRLSVEQNYSALSAACLMIRTHVYKAVDGLDEGHFAETHGDIDLCLKAAQAGFLTVWTPQVQIIHPGRIPEPSMADQALRDKWQAYVDQDPAYNKNLARSGKGFVMGSSVAVDWAGLIA